MIGSFFLMSSGFVMFKFNRLAIYPTVMLMHPRKLATVYVMVRNITQKYVTLIMAIVRYLDLLTASPTCH